MKKKKAHHPSDAVYPISNLKKLFGAELPDNTATLSPGFSCCTQLAPTSSTLPPNCEPGMYGSVTPFNSVMHRRSALVTLQYSMPNRNCNGEK